MPKYSFVIPVYKVEKYLDQCVESIICQTYQDFEIILVDDGSPDRCPQMCDGWAEKDSRIRAIHKKNAGASAARNVGIHESFGDYIVFLDSDDYWSNRNGLEKIDSLFDGHTDIVYFSSVNYYEREKTFGADRYNYPDEMSGLGPRECLEYMITHDLFNSHVAKRAFSKRFIVDNDLYFVEGIRAEDVEYSVRVANCLPRCRFLNEKLYVYRHRSESVTSNVDGKHLSEHLSIVENLQSYQYTDEGVQSWLLSYLAYSLVIVLAHVQFIKPDNSKELVDRIKKCCYLFKYTSYPRTRMISRFYHVFGFAATKLFLGWYLGRRWKK